MALVDTVRSSYYMFDICTQWSLRIWSLEASIVCVHCFLYIVVFQDIVIRGCQVPQFVFTAFCTQWSFRIWSLDASIVCVHCFLYIVVFYDMVIRGFHSLFSLLSVHSGLLEYGHQKLPQCVFVAFFTQWSFRIWSLEASIVCVHCFMYIVVFQDMVITVADGIRMGIMA